MSELLRLVEFALTSSVLIAAALLLSAALRRRASARSAYLAWLIVLIAVLLPIRPRLAPAIQVDTARVPAVEQRLQAAQRQQTRAGGGQRSGYSGVQVSAPADALAVLSEARSVPDAAPRAHLTPAQGILLTYALGAVVTLLIGTVKHLRYTRHIRRWRKPVTEPDVLTVYDECARKVGLRRKPRLYRCGAVSTPLVIGLLRPCLLLPDTRLNLPELRLVLCHELTHCRRGDLWIKLLQMIAACLHWYNPLAYAMNREINYACEASCDERVLRGADLDARQYYSETIIALIRRQTQPRTALTTTFYGGKKGMKKRIVSIMDMRARRWGALILCPVLLLALAFSVAFATERSPANTPADTRDLAAILGAPEAPDPLPEGVWDLAALFEEEGEPMSPEEAEQKAREHIGNIPEGARYEYRLEDIQYGIRIYKTAIMEILWDAETGDAATQRGERVYMTPVAGEYVLTQDLIVTAEGMQSWISGYTGAVLDNTDAWRLKQCMPQRAVVNNPSGASEVLYDRVNYQASLGICYNGTPVEVVEIIEDLCESFESENAVSRCWAHVCIGQGEDMMAEGYLPLENLTFEKEQRADLPALPVGTMRTFTDSSRPNVYGSDLFGTRQRIAQLDSGERVQLLGAFRVQMSGKHEDQEDTYLVMLPDGSMGYMLAGDILLDAEQAVFPRSAVVNNPVSFAANVTGMPTSYNMPQGFYFNGMSVEVLEVITQGNNVPMLTDAETVQWARVRVPQNGGEGIQGWMPLLTLSYADTLIGDVAALPEVTIISDAPTGHASLYAACSSEHVITSVASGTRAQLMGCFKAYYQVLLPGGECGFLPKKNVEATPEVISLIESVTPARLDDVQPGTEISYEEYMAAIEALWDEYGDSNEWPLEVKARASQIRLDSGWDTDLDVNILPGEGDMPEAEALALAQKYIEERYGISAADYLRYTEALYYHPGAPETHIWWFRFYARAGGYDCGVGFDQQGQVVRTFLSEYANVSSYTPEQLAERLRSISYYAYEGQSLGAVEEPRATELINETWALFESAYPEGKREDYAVTAEAMCDATGEMSADLRWEIVRIHPLRCAENVTWLDFCAAYVNGACYATDGAEYRDNLRQEQDENRLAELEAQLGLLTAWSVEDKAKYSAEIGMNDFYGLPGAGDISKQQAYDAAMQALQKEIGEEAARQCSVYFAFGAMAAQEGSCWRVDFYTPEMQQLIEAWGAALAAGETYENGQSLDGYIAFIDSKTGELTDFWTPANSNG